MYFAEDLIHECYISILIHFLLSVLQVCVESIRSRFGIDAGIVLEAMIESNCNNKATNVNPGKI